MTIRERIGRAIEHADGDKDILTGTLTQVIESHEVLVKDAARQLHSLINDESQLTIPLSDGCVAKVRFSKAINATNLKAFAKAFATIADCYVIDAPIATPQSDVDISK